MSSVESYYLSISMLLVPPIMYTLVYGVNAMRINNKTREKKKVRLPKSISYDTRLFPALILTLCIVSFWILIITNAVNNDRLYSCVTGLWSISTIPSMVSFLFTIFYSNNNKKYIFFTNKDILKSKSVDACLCIVGVVMFVHALFTAFLYSCGDNNGMLMDVLYCFDALGLSCVFFILAYVCCCLFNTLFYDETLIKMTAILYRIFDLSSPDVSFLQDMNKVSAEEWQRCSRYSTELYYDSFKKIKGETICSICGYDIENEELRNMDDIWYDIKKKCFIRGFVVYVIFYGLLGMESANGGLRILSVLLLVAFSIFYYCLGSIILFFKFPNVLVYSFAGTHEYIIKYNDDKKKRKTIDYLGGAFDNRYIKYIQARNSLIAIFILMIESGVSDSIIKKVFFLNLKKIHNRTSNDSVALLPFLIVDKYYYKKRNKHLFRPQKYISGYDEELKIIIDNEVTILGRNGVFTGN